MKRVTAQLFEPKDQSKPPPDDYGRMEVYRWLKQDEGRWVRWEEIKRLRGHVEADEVLEAIRDVTPANASAQRVKMDGHKWRAERLNREDYGPPTAQVNVAVQIGRSWLEALKEIEAEAAEIKDPPTEP